MIEVTRNSEVIRRLTKIAIGATELSVFSAPVNNRMVKIEHFWFRGGLVNN
jgi:hypothetical protein